MYVTSDIFDLQQIGRFRDVEWRENLVCGVAVYGSKWPGPEVAASFLIDAANLCKLTDGMQYAGYDLVGDQRTRPINPKTLERLALGRLTGAAGATGVVLTGQSPASGTPNGMILFGGSSSGVMRADYGTARHPNEQVDQHRPFLAYFVFPLNDNPVEMASELFQISAELLSCEYGYYYVRDEFCFPSAYGCGIAPALDYSRLADEEALEIHRWAEFSRDGLWTQTRPVLRDLYEVNLLSERHTAEPIEGLGYLTDWIKASAGRGRLEDIGQGRLLWMLTVSEMVNIRPTLNRSGLLFTCLDRVYRDWSGPLG